MTPNNSMSAAGAPLGAIRLWFFAKCVSMLQEGKNVWKNEGHAGLLNTVIELMLSHDTKG